MTIKVGVKSMKPKKSKKAATKKMVSNPAVDEDDDWEITNYGIDPELGGRYGVDFDDEVGFRD